MRREPGEEREAVGDPASGMDRERVALRARDVAVSLTVVGSFVCLGTALAGFTGYVLPRAVGLGVVFSLDAAVGFVLSVTVASRVVKTY